MSGPIDSSASSTPRPSPVLPAANIIVNNSAVKRSNFNVTGSRTQGFVESPGSAANEAQNTGDNVSKCPASSGLQDHRRTKRQKEQPTAQDGAAKIDEDLDSLGTAFVLTASEIRRILALQSRNALPDPLPRPYAVNMNGKSIIHETQPGPRQISDNHMIIRLIKSGAVQDMGYTWSDMTQLIIWLVRELTGKLNLLLDQDASNHSGPNGGLPGLVRNIKGRKSGVLKALIQWSRWDYVKAIDFRDIPA
jgi:hypothetical protein